MKVLQRSMRQPKRRIKNLKDPVGKSLTYPDPLVTKNDVGSLLAVKGRSEDGGVRGPVRSRSNVSTDKKAAAKDERKQQAESEFEKVQIKQEERKEQLKRVVTTLKSTDENKKHNIEALKKR